MHEKEIPGFTRIGSTAGQQPIALRVRRGSPQFEAEAWTNDLGDPENEPPAWSPLTGVTGRIAAYLDHMGKAGERIATAPVKLASDVLGTIYAATTGEPPEETGPLFDMAAGVATSLNRLLPGPIRRAITPEAPEEPAGYITLPDGRRIPVPKYKDPVGEGERARSDLLKNASRPGNYDAALERAKLQLAARKEQARSDEWSQTFALRQRQQAQAERLGALQEEALELALEKEKFSSAQRALWGRPSTIAPEPPRHRTVKMIGPGVPGGIQERLY